MSERLQQIVDAVETRRDLREQWRKAPRTRANLKFRRTSTIPVHAHPLVREMYAHIIEQNLTLGEVSERSGVAEKSISHWRSKYTPLTQNLEAVLNVLGYRLAIVPLKSEEAA